MREVEAGPGDVVAVADPAETRSYRALEPGTRIVCFGAGPGAEHAYGEWIGERRVAQAAASSGPLVPASASHSVSSAGGSGRLSQ